MNKVKYPLTSQKGLAYDDQCLIDAVNYDNGVRYVQNGDQLDDRGKAVQKELAEKLDRNFEEDVKNIEAYN